MWPFKRKRKDIIEHVIVTRESDGAEVEMTAVNGVVQFYWIGCYIPMRIVCGGIILIDDKSLAGYGKQYTGWTWRKKR